ncbi:hypothetical protein F7725_006761, partial [Dissostichus mawsoni]
FRPVGTVVIHWYKQQTPVHSYYYNKDQFGHQNKHFSGRTCLFNSHIPHGNASLLLRRVKVQDKGRYKCYTSTRKGNQEMFVNLEVKAVIQSVIMEMTEETVTCSSYNIYPVPQVTWATDPPSAQEALENSTIKTTDHKGLFNVESTLRILGNLSNYTYFCSFIAADKTQVWIASWKNQEGIIQEEGLALSIPCIALDSSQNFSLTWTFTSSTEHTVILRYDTKTRHSFNLWEGQAELDQDLLLLGDGSLLLLKPDIEEHSGTYTCTHSGLQSRHIIQTRVNITVASTTLKTRRASQRYNGAGFVEGGLHKHLNTTARYIIGPHGNECNGTQIKFEAQDELAGCTPNTAEDDTEALPEATEEEQEENPFGPLVEGNDGQPSCSVEREEFEYIEPVHTS